MSTDSPSWEAQEAGRHISLAFASMQPLALALAFTVCVFARFRYLLRVVRTVERASIRRRLKRARLHAMDCQPASQGIPAFVVAAHLKPEVLEKAAHPRRGVAPVVRALSCRLRASYAYGGVLGI